MAQRSAPPGAARPAGRLSPRVAQLATVLLTAVLTVATAVIYIPRQLDSDAFAGAPICPATASAARSSDCIRRLPVTVSLRGQTTGSGGTEWVDVQGIGTGTTQVDLYHADAEWSRLWPGETGAALLWRGDVVALGFGSSTLETPDWPDYRTMLAYWRFVPAASLLICAVLLWLVPRRTRHRRRFDFAGYCFLIGGSLYALLAVCLDHPAPLLYPPVLAGVALIGLVGARISRLVWTRRMRKRTEALIALRPPTDDRVVEL